MSEVDKQGQPQSVDHFSPSALQSDKQDIENSIRNAYGTLPPPTQTITYFVGRYDAAIKSIQVDPKFQPDLQQAASDILGIFKDGKLNGEDIPQDIRSFPSPTVSLPGDELDSRNVLVDIYKRDPDLARAIVAKKIKGAHGSSSPSYWGLFRYGEFMPQDPLRQRLKQDGIDFLPTGETVHAGAGLNAHAITFIHWRRILELRSYSARSIPPDLQQAITDLTPIAQTPSQKLRLEDLTHLQRFLQLQNRTPEQQELEELIQDSFPVIHLFGEDSLQDPITQNKVVTPSMGGFRNEYAIQGNQPLRASVIELVPRDKIDWLIQRIDAYNAQPTTQIKWQPLIFAIEDFLG